MRPVDIITLNKIDAQVAKLIEIRFVFDLFRNDFEANSPRQPGDGGNDLMIDTVVNQIPGIGAVDLQIIDLQSGQAGK